MVLVRFNFIFLKAKIELFLNQNLKKFKNTSRFGQENKTIEILLEYINLKN